MGPVPIQASSPFPQFGNAWDVVYTENFSNQDDVVRTLTLKEMAARLTIDVGALGKYDEENDSFA